MRIPRKQQAAGTLQTVERACDVLAAFQSDSELLRLKDVATRTGLDQATALRILRTLTARAFVERSGRFQYRTLVRLLRRRRWTLGYAAQSTQFAFSREVTESIRRAADREQMELIEVDNRYSRQAALRNAKRLIESRVSLVMEFQTDERVAPILSSMYQQAGIPVIAIEIPHPGATYFGANNYLAGLIGGRYLGQWAKQHWAGRVEEVLLLELPKAGPLPACRLTGALEGIREVLGIQPSTKVTRLNGNGQFGRSLEAVRKHLRGGPARRTLVAAINDPSAIGAARAFEECGWQERCAVMGQNASLEARAEMRRVGTRLVGSVSYAPECYGDELVRLAGKILAKNHVPPAVFVDHRLITPQNVRKHYPEDALLNDGELDALMLQMNLVRS